VKLITHVYREVRECLRLDPEHKDCFPHYKIVKKVDKLLSDAQENINNKNYHDCIASANKVRAMFIFSNFLMSYTEGKARHLTEACMQVDLIS
jgi:DnaJ family protein C protein 3